MILDIIFLVLVCYVLYRFVFNFLLPLLKAGRQMREQFRNMQGGMGPQEQDRSPETHERASGSVEKHSSPHGKPEDYIDFEEVKK